MLAELGQISLIIAFLLCLLQGWMGLVGAHIDDRRAMGFAEREIGELTEAGVIR